MDVGIPLVSRWLALFGAASLVACEATPVEPVRDRIPAVRHGSMLDFEGIAVSRYLCADGVTPYLGPPDPAICQSTSPVTLSADTLMATMRLWRVGGTDHVDSFVAVLRGVMTQCDTIGCVVGSVVLHPLVVRQDHQRTDTLLLASSVCAVSVRTRIETPSHAWDLHLCEHGMALSQLGPHLVPSPSSRESFHRAATLRLQ